MTNCYHENSEAWAEEGNTRRCPDCGMYFDGSAEPRWDHLPRNAVREIEPLEPVVKSDWKNNMVMLRNTIAKQTLAINYLLRKDK